MEISKKKLFYRILLASSVIVSCIAFSPLVIPYGKYEPSFLALPYTLWTGLLVAMVLVFITYLVTLVHPGKGEDES